MLFASFSVGVFASSVFSNATITRRIFILSTLAQFASGLRLLFTSNFVYPILMELFVGWFILLCSFLLANVIIRFGQDNLQALMKSVHQQQDMKEQLKLDSYTGLYNKKYFDELLPQWIYDCTREGVCLSLAAIDLDFFKRVNDRYGHAAGDRVLLLLSNILKNAENENTLIFRTGGEEFAILFKGLCLDDAFVICEELRLRMQASSLEETDHKAITFSCGLSCTSHCCTPEGLSKASDSALYTAKNNGRNQVVVYELATGCVQSGTIQ